MLAFRVKSASQKVSASSRGETLCSHIFSCICLLPSGDQHNHFLDGMLAVLSAQEALRSLTGATLCLTGRTFISLLQLPQWANTRISSTPIPPLAPTPCERQLDLIVSIRYRHTTKNFPFSYGPPLLQTLTHLSALSWKVRRGAGSPSSMFSVLTVRAGHDLTMAGCKGPEYMGSSTGSNGATLDKSLFSEL